MGESCSCTYKQNIPISEVYGYVVNGTSYTETDPADASVSTSDFCVDGNTLRVKSSVSLDVYTR
jgi:hypothetical protein